MDKYSVKVNGVVYDVEIEECGSFASAPIMSSAVKVTPAAAPAAPKAAPAPAAPKAAPAAVPAGASTVTCPLPGTVLKINVSAGQAVKKGDVLLIVEAMKMENEIMAANDGVVSAVNVSVGQTVETGDVLVTM